MYIYLSIYILELEGLTPSIGIEGGAPLHSGRTGYFSSAPSRHHVFSLPAPFWRCLLSLRFRPGTICLPSRADGRGDGRTGERAAVAQTSAMPAVGMQGRSSEDAARGDNTSCATQRVAPLRVFKKHFKPFSNAPLYIYILIYIYNIYIIYILYI